MTDRRPEDQLLEEALKRQRLLVDFYKQAAKEAPEKQCKELFKHLQSALQDQVGDVASELARHRKERSLGRPVADQQG
ncbi:MAG: hypothetical protein M3P51_08270 [Chloroflexota bacterium]|nr:hypothetical protein [Chloroflexota bacterium]